MIFSLQIQSAIFEAPNDTGNYILMSSRYKLSFAQLITLPFQTTSHDFHLFFLYHLYQLILEE